MKNEEIYDAWKEQKSQIRIRKDFPDEVINQKFPDEEHSYK